MRGGRRVVLKVVRYSAKGVQRYAKTKWNVKEEKSETGEREGCTVSTRKT